ncbi:MAG: undecaprenyl-diphosphatase UppP [candidate division Zixibacteria bacterium]|nr:undecaprenyl-diphosphatase UppP [candidate division Zixibacteria bacterium]
MTVWDAIILGIVQGLTEFLPISSSGHLVLCQHILGVKTPGVSLEIWLHLGTFVAVIGYFYKKIIVLTKSLLPGNVESETTYNRKTILAIIIGTIPAVVVGLGLKSYIESVFSSPVFASSMLLVTAAILFASAFAKNKKLPLTLPKGLVIGLSQAVAILPGISRSGSTITCAMLLGMKPSEAAEFSFLLAIPAVGGAFLLDLISHGRTFFTGDEIMLYLIGTAASFIFGLLSIHYLLKIIKKGSFYLFGFYCLAAGIISLVYIV